MLGGAMSSDVSAASEAGGPRSVVHLEALLFKATNPTNKIEDVNTIKQFCDAVCATSEGAVIACRLIAHKIQSPQEREAVQALAVLEACVKACGKEFATEVGKFKFLNEMVKLVSPKYLGSRTPEHIKKKVIEILYVWTKELKDEPKIAEAYNMLKSQGIVKEDPEYVGGAVFAAALPPRDKAPLSEEQSRLLKRLLQSKNPDDLEQANRIIKGMVKEDERKMDALAKRSTELIMVNNNSKLLHEMLDHYDKLSSGPEEKELLKELFESCEKMQPKLFRLASETEDNDSSIAEILQASDDLSKVIDRYRMVIVQGKADIMKPLVKETSDTLLDLDPVHRQLDDVLGLDGAGGGGRRQTEEDGEPPPYSAVASAAPPALPSSSSATAAAVQPCPSVDDLLNGSPIQTSAPLIDTGEMMDVVAAAASSKPKNHYDVKIEEEKSSRQRGLEELDFLGETAIKTHLTSRSPQFVKREKVSMNRLQQQKKADDLKLITDGASSEESAVENKAEETADDNKALEEKQNQSPVPGKESPPPPAPTSSAAAGPAATSATTTKPTEVKLGDLEVPLSCIKPGDIPPMTLTSDDDDDVSIVLNFGRDSPREHVSAVVVTIINKSSYTLSDFELKAIVPKGCRVKLQTPSGKELPPHNPFVPPSAITQVMLVAKPPPGAAVACDRVSLKYVLSYLQDGEPQTSMGGVDRLPI